MGDKGQFLVLAAAVCWGTTGTAQALAPSGASPLSIGAVRLVLGGAVLLMYALVRGSLKRGKKWQVWVTLVTAASMAAYQVFFFAGVARTGVAVGTIVGIGSSPILAGFIAFLVLKERPGMRWILATGFAVVGCSLLLAAGSSIQVDVQGVALAIGAGAAYAVFTVASKELLVQHPPEAVMAVSFCLGALFLLPLSLTSEISWLAEPRGALIALHLGIITVGLAYTLFAQGLSLVPVATAATLTLAEPLTAGILGIGVLGETLSTQAFAGIALIIAGLVLLSTNRKNHESSSRYPPA